MNSRKFPQLNDKKWICKQYIKNRQSCKQIGDIIGCDSNNVKGALNSYGIVLRSKSEARRRHHLLYNKDFLYQKYIIEGIPIKKIAKEIGCTVCAVYPFLYKFNIPVRGPTEKAAINNNFIDNEEIVNGLMLGDGSLILPEGRNHAYLLVQQVKKNLVLYIKSLVCPTAIIKQCLYKPHMIGLKAAKASKLYKFWTRVSPILTSYYSKWYKNKIKIVPNDLKMTPVTLLHWFLGDGSSSYIRGRKNAVVLTLNTQGFKQKEVVFLQSLLKPITEFNINLSGIKSNGEMSYILRTSRISEIIKFYNYIGECPVKCMSYRWKIPFYVRPGQEK
jgi:hypothetical protein